MPRNRALGWATVAIMNAIRAGHRFGLDVMNETGFPSGTVYPTLARLEARGYVASTWEESEAAKEAGRPRRRYYQVTADGSAALDQALARLGLLTGSAEASASPERA